LPELSIRNATITDAKLLAELGARTFWETFAAGNTAEDMNAYLAESFHPAQQSAELSDHNTYFKIAEVDGVAVGYAMLRAGVALESISGENPIELVRLYVSKDSIGSGVGAALMRECLRESTAGGHKTIWLGVWEHNVRAQAFYRKWNFVEVDTHIFQLGDDAQRDLLMCRSLVPPSSI
jgi:ribosomal protein S18 acetylase RimI-like enzyme